MNQSVCLSSVAKVFNGKTPAVSEQRSCGHPVLKVRDVDEHGRFRGRGASFVDEQFAAKFVERWTCAGDTLILNAAHNSEYVGSKTFFVAPEAAGLLTTGEWLLIRPDSSALDASFLHHWVGSACTKAEIRRRVKGIHLYPRDVADLFLHLPHLQEQKRIAAILDKADAVRTKRRDTLAQADALLRSAFDHIVGFRAPGYDSWQTRSIGSLAAARPNALRTGPFGSDLRHSEFTDNGVVVLGIDNAVQNRFTWAERRFISPEKYRKLERYRVFPGDVIVTIMGTTGRSAVVPDDVPLAISTKHLATITLDRDQADPHFISFAIHSDSRLRRQVGAANKGAIMDGLNLTIIRSLKLHLPPLPLQRRFAELVRWYEERVEQAQDPAENGDALYASLAQRAFRGEL